VRRGIGEVLKEHGIQLPGKERKGKSMSTVTQAACIRAYPHCAQRRMLDSWFGAGRWVWNTALDIRSGAYRQLKLRLNSNDISRWLGTSGWRTCRPPC
jgi:hypothetical protein